jgi:alpha-beta hydrolase superfamily lysophospholipase
VHGTGEHSGRYAALADALVARRFTVVALDLPGHGEAPGPRGDWPSWTDIRDRVIPSMFTLTRGMPGQPPDLPVVLLGHSMGGLLALDFALAHPKTLLGVVASGAALRSPPPPGAKVLLGKMVGAVAPTAGFPNGIATYFAMLEARKRVMGNARRLAVPALLQHGAADKVTDPRGSLEFNAGAPHGLVRLLTYRDAYHEIFNDPARTEAIKDLVGWLDAIVVV